MFQHKKLVWFLAGATACLTLVGVAYAQLIGTADLNGVLTETSTGYKMRLLLKSAQNVETPPGPHQDDRTGGGGSVNAVFWGQLGIPVSGCSYHAPTVPHNIDNDNSGVDPLTAECGRAWGQTVSVDGCIVKTSFHGYTHSDHPRINYAGPVTVDITIHKTNSKTGVDLTVNTPKGPIQVSGTFDGTVDISSCR